MTLPSVPLSAPVGVGAPGEEVDGLDGGLGRLRLRSVASSEIRRADSGGRRAAVWMGDISGALLSSMLVAWVEPWLGATSTSARTSFTTVTFVALLAGLAVQSSRAGRRRRLVPTVSEDLGSVLGVLACVGVVLLALHGFDSFRTLTPEPEVGLAIGTAALIVPAARAAVLSLLGSRAALRTVVVGNGPLADEVVRRVGRSRFVAIVGPDPAGTGDPSPVRTFEDLAAVVAAGRVDKMLVIRSAEDEDDGTDVLQALRGLIDIDIVCSDYALCGWDTRVSDITGLSVLRLGQTPDAAAAKRLMDVVVAALALVLLSPVLAVMAVAVRLDSPGPVLFRQRRMGRWQRPFTIYKFRTMRTSTHAPAANEEGCGRIVSITGDPRDRRTPLDTVADPALVTGVGAFLRRTGLDELPQLWNVLRGEMSIVGPRPFVPDECAAIEGWRARRFEVRPGMTGLWQVCGQHEVTMDDLCRLDVQYATGCSIASDLRIIARTPTRLLRGSRYR